MLWETVKGSLCIFPCKQGIQELVTSTQLFTIDLKQGKRKPRVWSFGWPSLMCHKVLLKLLDLQEDAATWSQVWEDKTDKVRWLTLWG